MTPELVERGDRLIVSAPFNRRWYRWTRESDGMWAPCSMAWVFRVEQREAVEKALAEIFEEDEA